MAEPPVSPVDPTLQLTSAQAAERLAVARANTARFEALLQATRAQLAQVEDEHRARLSATAALHDRVRALREDLTAAQSEHDSWLALHIDVSAEFETLSHKLAEAEAEESGATQRALEAAHSRATAENHRVAAEVREASLREDVQQVTAEIAQASRTGSPKPMATTGLSGETSVVIRIADLGRGDDRSAALAARRAELAIQLKHAAAKARGASKVAGERAETSETMAWVSGRLRAEAAAIRHKFEAARRRSDELDDATTESNRVKDRIQQAIGQMTAQLGDLERDPAASAEAASEVAARLRQTLRRLEGARAEAAAWTARVAAQPDLTDLGSGPPSLLGSSAESALEQDSADALKALIGDALKEFWAVRSPSESDRSTILRKVEELATVRRLRADLPTMHSRSGSAHVLGDGSGSLRLTLGVRLARRRNEPLVGLNARPPAETHGETRASSQTGSPIEESGNTNRDLVLSGRHLAGLGEVGWLRMITPSWSLRITHNEFLRSTGVHMGASNSNIIRNREPTSALRFDVEWTVRVEVATEPAGKIPTERPVVEERTLSDPRPLTVWFQESILRPQRPAKDIAGSRIPRLAALDALHDPGSVEAELMERIVVNGVTVLKTLNADSRRSLIRFLSTDNLRGGFPRLRNGGMISDPLYDSEGRPVGLLLLSAVFAPRIQQTEAPVSLLETYHRAHIAEFGVAGLRNATEAAFSAGATLVGKPIDQTVVSGTYAFGGPNGGYRVRTSDTVQQHSGGPAAISRGQKNGTHPTVDGEPAPTTVTDADVYWTARLITDGEHTPAHWVGSVARGTGGRLRYVPTTFTPPEAGMHPPASVEYGDGIGMADVDEFEIVEQDGVGLDEAVRQWLTSEEFIATGPKATDLQLTNYRNLVDVASNDYREALWDELEAGGVWVPFNRVTSLGGTEQFMVRWWVTRDGSASEHLGATTDVRNMFAANTSYRLDRSERGVDTHAWQFGVEAGIPLGADNPVSHIPVTFTPYSTTQTADVLPSNGPSGLQEVIMEGESGARVETFRSRFELRAEIYGPGDNVPRWSYSRQPGGQNFQAGSVRFWVPRFLTLTERGDPPPPHQTPPVPELPRPTIGAVRYQARAITPADRKALERPVEQRLPAMYGVTHVGGSRELNAAFRAAIIEVFGDVRGWLRRSLTGASPAAEASTSAQVRRAFVSTARLRGHLSQMLNGAYVTDQVFQPGSLSQGEGALDLRAYSGRPVYVPPREGHPPEFYVEDVIVGSHNTTRGRSSRLVRGLEFMGGPASRFSRQGWNATVPVNGGFRWGVSTTDSSQTRSADIRIPNYEHALYTLHIPLTFIGSVHGAARNVANAVAALIGTPAMSADFALDVPEAVEVHASLDELFGIWRATRAGLPEGTPAGEIIASLPSDLVNILQELDQQRKADDVARARAELMHEPDIRYLPRRIAARLGLGDAVLVNVQESGRSRQLYQNALAELDRLVPGMTQPGSNTYMPGVRQNIAALTSPAGLRSAATRFFRTRDRPTEDSETTLTTMPFVTTYQGGAVLVMVVLKARPAPAFATTAGALRHFGRNSSTHGLESHEASGAGRSETIERSRELRGGVSVTATAPGEQGSQVRRGTPRAEGALNRMRRTATMLGGFDNSQTTSKPWEVFDVPVPLELSVQVHPVPLPGAPRAALLPHLVQQASRLWTAVMGAGEEPPTRWVPAVATVRVAEADGTPVPLQVQPPAWHHPPTVFDADPREVHVVEMGDAAPGFSSNQVREWAPFDGMPEGYKVSWFNGSQALASSAKKVLPHIAGNTPGELDIDGFLNGVAATPFVHELLRPTGRDHVFDAVGPIPLVRNEGQLGITPVLATPWFPATDQMADRTEPFAISEFSTATVENSPIRSTSSSTVAVIGQHLSVNANVGPNPWTKRPNVHPALGPAPGNRTLTTVSAQVSSATSGKVVRTTAQSNASARRGLRMIPRPKNGPKGPSSNVMMARHILFQVRGTSGWRLSAGGGLHGNTTRVLWLVATVEARMHQSQLPLAGQAATVRPDVADKVVDAPQAVPRVPGPGAESPVTPGPPQLQPSLPQLQPGPIQPQRSASASEVGRIAWEPARKPSTARASSSTVHFGPLIKSPAEIRIPSSGAGPYTIHPVPAQPDPQPAVSTSDSVQARAAAVVARAIRMVIDGEGAAAAVDEIRAVRHHLLAEDKIDWITKVSEVASQRREHRADLMSLSEQLVRC